MNNRLPQPRKSSPSAADDEVNQLLQAAQDELLLNLSVSSHTVSNSDLDPDLARRFLALKSRPSASPVPVPSPALAPPQQPRSSATPSVRVQGQADDELKTVLGDDLSARFAALRGPTSSGSRFEGPASGVNRSSVDEDEDEEEEVEKLLRWAMDAARLDPSPPSDDDGDDVISSDSDSDVGNENEKGNSSRKQK